MNIGNVIKAMRRHKRFLISGHVDPEADSVGCQLAVAAILKRLGKQAVIVDEDPPPDSCGFMPLIKTINLFKDVTENKLKKPDCVVIVDCPSLDRIGRVKELITDDMEIINIDHHISNERFGHINWIDLKAAAVGQMVFDIYRRLKIKLSKNERIVIYSAILIDTGSFRFLNTTAKTHMIAAELIKEGLDTNAIYEHLFEMKSFEVTRLLGLSLSGVKRSRDGKTVWMWSTREMLKRSGAKMVDAENFIGFPRAVKGCKVAIFFKETADKKTFKVSFRGKKGIDVNKLASVFGGGGHPQASGCTIFADTRAQAERKILKEVYKIV